MGTVKQHQYIFKIMHFEWEKNIYDSSSFITLRFFSLCPLFFSLDLWKTTQLSREDWKMGQKLVTYVRDIKQQPESDVISSCSFS